MSTTPDSPAGTSDSGARGFLAVIALLLAVAVLAAASQVPNGDTANPTGGRVLPGKISVIGDAKVRHWTGETFTMEVPLSWSYAPEDADGREYVWALLRDEDNGDINTRAGLAYNPDWATARTRAQARVRVKIMDATNRSARDLAYAHSARVPDTFVDLGGVNFRSRRKGSKGRRVWRLDIASGGTIESDYYFATCRRSRPFQTWHVVINRSALRGRKASKQQAVFDEMMASLNTDSHGTSESANGSKDCDGAAGSA